MTRFQYHQMKHYYESTCNVSSWGLNAPTNAFEIMLRYVELVAALKAIVGTI